MGSSNAGLLVKRIAMKITSLDNPDVLLIEPEVFEDERGCFFEAFNQSRFTEAAQVDFSVRQINQSTSKRGVLRGLHYQLPPKSQAKLVRVLRGEIFDVAVDIRKNSPTFGGWVSQFLSATNRKQLFVPKGFAHGFLALSETTTIEYAQDEFYDPSLERILKWSDADLGINWPDIDPIAVIDRDQSGKALRDIEPC